MMSTYSLLLVLPNLVPDYQGTNCSCLGTPDLYFHGRLLWDITLDNLGTSATNPLRLSLIKTPGKASDIDLYFVYARRSTLLASQKGGIINAKNMRHWHPSNSNLETGDN